MRRWFLGLLCMVCFPWGARAASPSEWIAKGQGWYKCSQTGGTTNVATATFGTDFAHSLVCTIDANFLTANSVLQACATVSVTTGATAPTLLMKLKAGAAGTTTLVAPGTASAPATNLTGMSSTLCFQTIIAAAPGASVNTYSGPLSYLTAVGFDGDNNVTPQPVALATNGSLAWTFTSNWGSNIAGASLVLRALSVDIFKP